MTSALPYLQFLPELVLLAGALAIFAADAMGVRARRTEIFGGIAAGASALALALVVADLGFSPLSFLRGLASGQLDAPATTASLYAFTSLGLVFQGVFLVSAFLVALASTSRPSDEPGASIFFGLLLTATLGMLLVAVAADLIFLLLAIEI